jgi:septum formation protein
MADVEKIACLVSGAFDRALDGGPVHVDIKNGKKHGDPLHLPELKIGLLHLDDIDHQAVGGGDDDFLIRRHDPVRVAEEINDKEKQPEDQESENLDQQIQSQIPHWHERSINDQQHKAHDQKWDGKPAGFLTGGRHIFHPIINEITVERTISADPATSGHGTADHRPEVDDYLLSWLIFPVSKEKIILASASPRRRELLAEMGVSFEVVTADVREFDEFSSPRMTPVSMAIENASLKAEAAAALRPKRWVLGADTVVVMESRAYGKPASLDVARINLQALSGKTHEVITACALIDPNGKKQEFYEATKVTFYDLNPEIIERYLAAVPVLDKAGAYALQEHGDWIVERVEGSRNNVIGLPTEKLAAIFQTIPLL